MINTQKDFIFSVNNTVHFSEKAVVCEIIKIGLGIVIVQV